MKKISPFLLLFLSACANLDNNHVSWPNNLPNRAFFVQDYIQKRGHQPAEPELNKHLTWIKRFYVGSRLAPTGWNKMTEQLLNSFKSDTTKESIQSKMFLLGKKISTEWAQDNSIRKINTGHISIWGEALKNSVKLDQQMPLINQIEQDIDGLIASRIDPKLITSDRYYVTDDYNDF